MFVVACLPLSFVRAGIISPIADAMSDQTVSAMANHDIEFTNSDAISTSGQIMQVGFDSAFDLTAITASDIRFSHGVTTGLETVETLSGSGPAAGVWGVSISSNAIHLLAPTDVAPGELPVGQKVIIKIGTNAGGTHQITNPSTAGNYVIRIFGSAGEYNGLGSVRVPITDASTSGFSIGFTVRGASSGHAPVDPGCGTACPPVLPPTTPVVITNVVFPSITDSYAEINWDTNVSTISALYWVQNNGSITPSTSQDSGQHHTAMFVGLTPDTAYQFTLIATSTEGVVGTYAPGAFHTRPLPVLSNVMNFAAERQSDHTVVLRWQNPSSVTTVDGYTITIVARDDRYPTSLNDSRTILNAFATTTSDAPGNGSQYYAAFIRHDSRASSGSVASVTAEIVLPVPPVVPPPVIPQPTPAPSPVPTPSPSPSPSTPTRPTAPHTPSHNPPSQPVAAPISSPTPPTEPIGPTPTTTPSILPQPTIEIPTAATTTSTTQPSAPTTPQAPTPVTPPVFRAETTWKSAEGTLQLAQGDQIPSVYASDSIQLIVSTSEPIQSGRIDVEGSHYALAQSGQSNYSSIFVVSNTPGTINVRIVLRTNAGLEKVYSKIVSVIPPARILEHDGLDVPAVRAQVIIQKKNGKNWEPLNSSVATLGDDGAYRYYLPTGEYRYHIIKDGWATVDSEFSMSSSGPVGQNITLQKPPQNPVAAVLRVIRTPQTEAVAQTVAPVAVIAAISVTTAAAGGINLLNYLRFLLTQPLLLLRRRKRDKWGLVYNSLSKRPIDLVIVRLVDATTGTIKQTRITDALGRYAFIVQTGNYRIQVVKPGYVYPSQYLANEKIDVDFVDLYHNEPIAAAASAVLTPNIPIDPIENAEVPSEIIKKTRWRLAQRVLSVGSLVVAIAAVVIQPSSIMIGLAVVQVLFFVLFRRLAVPAKPKNWGITYDGKTRKPLKRAIIRIFDKKYNKLLETQLTDKDGKYAFFAGKNVYYVTADHDGYDRFVSKEIDLRNQSMGVIHEPLALLPKSPPDQIPSSAVS